MAKGPTFDTITAGFTSAAKLNSNFAAVVTSFDNTISRDGSTPNTMSVDFDMNSNDILNAGTVNADEITVDGVSIATQVTAAATSATAAAASETAAAASATTVATLTEFTNLTDTPSTFSGHGSKFLKVDSGGTAVEFVAGSATEPSDGDKGDITVSGGAGLVWNIDTGVVDAANLATDSVETAKIKNVNVTTGKIALNAVTLNLLQHGTTGDILYYGASGEPFRLSKGSDAEVLTLASGLPSWAAAATTDNFMHVREQQADGADGGTFTFNAWRTRTLNTEVTNTISGASINTGTSVITLPTGTYYIDAVLPAIKVNSHKGKLRNTSGGGSDEIIGMTVQSPTSNDSGGSVAFVTGRFTIASEKTFELQHRCGTTRSNDGFGNAATFGVIEVYSDVKIWKI